MLNKKVISLITLLFLITSGFICNPNRVLSYSSHPTHPNLAREMIRLYNMYYDPDITDEKVRQILQGSIDEDMAPRWSFHLYDPIYNRAPFGVYTAKQWAINSNIQGDAIHKFANILLNLFNKKENEFRYHGDFSWEANINNYAKNKEQEAWYGIGHILHLIADMTVPAHSRNDSHMPWDGEPYESWAENNSEDEDYIFAEDIYHNREYGSVDLDFISEAFDDLAKYSNHYFFSSDTVLNKNYESPVITRKQSEDYGFVSQRWYVWGQDELGNLFRLAQIEPLKSAWYEVSPYAQDLVLGDNYFIDKNDQKLNSDYFQRLAPKVVQYGVGVIRLFIEDAEYEKAKLARQKNPSQLAKIFDPLEIFDTNPQNSTYEPLPEIKPSKLPGSLSVVVSPPIEPSSDNPPNGLFVASEQPSNNEQPPMNQRESNGDIVFGPTTGGDGGLSQGTIDQLNSSAEPETTATSSVPPVPPAPSPPEPPAPPVPPIPPVLPSHLVINEIQIRNNEFVELYNPTTAPIDLTGYYFSYYSSARDWNDPYRNQEFPASASVPAGGYYLIGFEGYSTTDGNPNTDWQPYSTDQLSNSNGSVAIFPFDPKTASESQSKAIDAVAWGDVDFVREKAEFQTELGQDKSMQRIDYKDNNDNNIDFEYQKIPSPTNSLSQTIIPGTIIKDTTVISTDTIWTIAGSPYYIESNAGQWPIVESGATLIIEPGVVLMPQNSFYTFLEIRGTLKAKGTTADKIVFTSKNDADYGGPGVAAAGDFKNIVFTSTSTNSIFDYVLFRYGGKDTEVIKIDGSSVEIKNSTIENSFKNGIYLNNSNSKIQNSEIKNNLGTGIIIEGIGSAPEISDCQINDNQQYGIETREDTEPLIKNNYFSGNLSAPIYMKGAYPQFMGNNATNNVYNGIVVSSKTLVSQDITWKPGLVYILESNFNEYVTVDEGATLTIEPGVIIKPKSQYYNPLLIKGTIKAEATPGNEIVFTSIYDDTFGGDTNNDGNLTIPQSNDWKKIKFESTSTDSVLDYVFMYYGTGVPPIETIGSASVDMRDTVSFTP